MHINFIIGFAKASGLTVSESDKEWARFAWRLRDDDASEIESMGEAQGEREGETWLWFNCGLRKAGQ